MRLRLRLVALALVALLASGCFVFDELDKGSKELDKHSATRNDKVKKQEAAAAKAAGPAKAEDPNAKQKTWWERARTISAADKPQTDNPHVRCKVQGKELFMLQSDCVSQGGRVAPLSAD
jgi:hypothetical protein